MTERRILSDPRFMQCALPFLLQGTAVAALGLGKLVSEPAAKVLAIAALAAFLAGCLAARRARRALFALVLERC